VEFDTDNLRKICRRHGIDLVVLFGSRAREEVQAASDLDIAVHLRGRKTACDKLALLADLNHLFKRTIDLVVLNTVSSDTLRHEIFKYGKPLYDATGELFVNLKVDAFLRYGNSEYLRRVKTQALIKHMGRLAASGVLPVPFQIVGERRD